MPLRLSFSFGLSGCQIAISQAVFFGILHMLCPIQLMAAEEVDTTSGGYRIGYEIGSWLPFIILAVLFLVMLRSLMKRNSVGPPDL
jgi:hypothetical protein